MASIIKKTGEARHEHLKAMAEMLAGVDCGPGMFLAQLRESNLASCEPPLNENELEQIAIRYKPSCREFLDKLVPDIVTTARHLREITADALEALYYGNYPEHIFRRSGGLVRISRDEERRPYVEPLAESALRGLLARACNFLHTYGQDKQTPISPPLDVVRDCLTVGDWRFSPLLGIIEAPVMRPDGTVVTEAGYDAVTHLYYDPASDLTIPPIPEIPSDDDIARSVELILDPLADFPFDSDASLANAIATMFTPILRPMITGPVPLALFDKPQQGTGASLLAEVVTIVATGRPAAMMTAQKDDEGWRKAITSLLLKGQLVVTIDNIEQDLMAPSLAAVLTATTYQDRILGRSEMVQLPNRTTWLATGNNIRLRGDLPRRCIWIRMDAHMARPWLRDRCNFKYPQLAQWVVANRGVILAALLTLARAWVVAGKPVRDDTPMLGGYESYCQVLGGVLSFLGIKHFLANLGDMYDETDSETPQWEGFLDAWQEYVGKQPVTVAEVITVLNENAEFRATLPDSLMGKDSRDYSRRLGNALSRRNGVRYPNSLMIHKAGNRRRAIAWQVLCYDGVSYDLENPQAKLALGG